MQSANLLTLKCTGHPRPELVTLPTPSYPRGPPRKPKQSGYALWVGNLPPATTIGDLKDHFSREATNDIESLFLISKSNCAFVNYRTEAVCAAAMGRFHESKFHGVRLVCRLRRGTPTSGYSSSTTPDSLTPESSNEADKPGRKELRRATSGPVIVDSSASQSPKKELQHDGTDGVDGLEKADGQDPARVPEKYFVVKSLTLQDLEASVRSGVWATQSHNEVALNNAYEV
jgi:RNA recognition motif-containing protein